MSWLSAFAVMFALDVVWALYTISMVAKQTVRASTYAALIQTLTGSLVLAYTHEPVLLVPACAGAFAGTFVVTDDRCVRLYGRGWSWLKALWDGHKAPPEI